MRDRMMMSLLLIVLAALAPAAAAEGEPDFAKGQWHRATLEIDAKREIPFFLWLPEDDSQDAVIRNGEEDIAADFRRTEDGVIIGFPHYDSRIEARRIPLDAPPGWRMVGEARYEGVWRKRRRQQRVEMQFRATPTVAPGLFNRFEQVHVGAGSNYRDLDLPPDEWSISFSKSGRALGRFERVFGRPDGYTEVHGTIETPTGDYRFLEGVGKRDPSRAGGRILRLSVFDGAHAFLIEGETDESGERMTGHFYSGNWWHETFTARRLAPGETVQLPDPFEEVELTSGDGRLHLPALREPPYAGAPTIVVIFGTWCPNCHDEASVLADLYDKHHTDGLQILSLAYEHTGDDARSRRQVERFKERYGIDWEIQIQGDSDKANASASLPDLSAVKSYPTTIWINRDGSVRAIHSGFSGPATGEEHEELLAEFKRLTREILESKPAAAP